MINRTWPLMLLVLFGGALTASAQDEVTCAAFVTETLGAVEQGCAAVEAGQVCYGSAPVEAAFASAAPTFARRGDSTALETVTTITTDGYNVDDPSWGVASIALPGSATLLVMGNVTLSDVDDGVTVFALQRGTQASTCDQALDGVLVRAPAAPLMLTVNGVGVQVTGEAFLTEVDGALRVTTRMGQATVTAEGAKVPVAADEFIVVAAGGQAGVPQPLTDVQVAALVPLSEAPVLPKSGEWTYLVIEQSNGCFGQMEDIMGFAASLGEITFAFEENGAVMVAVAAVNDEVARYERAADGRYVGENATFEVVTATDLRVTAPVEAIANCNITFEYAFAG